ncbi:MAG TPA: DUF4241 domain-containing protein [Kofleriaceae bacterium]|nr:DUF4241 domain-containing protein [Kofleriaceae bacterium]
MAKTKGKAAKPKASARPTKPKASARAAKPKSTRVTTPVQLPPTLPPAPAPRDELQAERDIGRLLRYGERFGAKKIDTRMWTTLPVPSGALAICDPAAAKSWRVLDRPAGAGQFRVMLSVARSDAGAEALAALVIHTGHPPIARWTIAHPKGRKPKEPSSYLVTSGWLVLVDADAGSPGVIATPDAKSSGPQPIEVPLTDGRKALAVPCGNGDFTAYWAVDATDKPICLVIDFDAFTQKDWRAKS